VPEPPTTYLIRVRGVLDPGWSAWFAGMEVRSDRPGETVVVGPVVDQAALHGLLARIRDLGLPLILGTGGTGGGPGPVTALTTGGNGVIATTARPASRSPRATASWS
jgi:hypothetical protein